MFLSQVGEDLSKETDMDIMDEVNCTVNNLTEGVEDDAYVGTTPTAGTEVIKDLTGRDPGSQSKRLKDFLPTVIEAISDPVMGIFSKLQVRLNHSAEVIVGAQASISLLNSKMGDVLEDHTTILCTMGDITKNLISHGAVLNNLDLYSLMKEAAREAHILTVNIKNMWMMLWHRQCQQLPRLDICLRL